MRPGYTTAVRVLPPPAPPVWIPRTCYLLAECFTTAPFNCSTRAPGCTYSTSRNRGASNLCIGRKSQDGPTLRCRGAFEAVIPRGTASTPQRNRLCDFPVDLN